MSLLQQCCPTAIRRLIVPIVVDAFKRQSFRLWPHVGQEILKSVFSTPTVADRDAASAIVLESFIVGIVTALNRTTPRNIFRRNFTVACVTVLEKPFSRKFFSQTSARASIFLTMFEQNRCRGNASVPTDAQTQPMDMLATMPGSSSRPLCCKASESLISEVVKLRPAHRVPL